MNKDYIVIKGAREHNLKNVDLSIPRNKLVVFTGVSGSGKSTLAFDTIYAEGQRRYIESLSSYARQFLGQMDKPELDSIEGLSPSIAIDQQNVVRSPRSTVGTITEIYDYLRLLYAKIGQPYCYSCGDFLYQHTVDQMVDHVLNKPEGSKFMILAPIVSNKKGKHAGTLESLHHKGYVRVRVNGEIKELEYPIGLDEDAYNTIEVLVDRMIVKEGIRKRLADSLETALKDGEGSVILSWVNGKEEHFNDQLKCGKCNITYPKLEPRLFSFNSPTGACDACHGLGYQMNFTESLVVGDESLSINEGAIAAPGWSVSKTSKSQARSYLIAVAETYGFSLDTPYKLLSNDVKDVIMNGSNGRLLDIQYEGERGITQITIEYEGILPNLHKRYIESSSEMAKYELEKFMKKERCHECDGTRLNKFASSVLVSGKTITDMSNMSIEALIRYLSSLHLKGNDSVIGEQILKEIKSRLCFLKDVGLSYLTLSRDGKTLSGGESQRIRLATQIGSGLTGVTYILDEPSIGLHQRDNQLLIGTMKKLRDLGNSIIVVEHDEETIKAADYIVDIGVMAGIHGGEVIAEGTLSDIKNTPESLTGMCLNGGIQLSKHTPRTLGEKTLKIIGARENNLKNMNVSIPLNAFVCVSGVSGSGKSTLINDILYNHLAKQLNRSKSFAGDFDKIEGVQHLDKVIKIDQSPIGKSSRSNPATYTGLFDMIRDLFATTSGSKRKGYKKGRFSFNVKGGRCEICKGDGTIKINMYFLPNAYVPCEACGGKRFNRETLEVTYKGKNIHDVLEMNIGDAKEFFKNHKKMYRILKTLDEVGLSYLKLGQPSNTLSGGEAQRVKLANELSKVQTGKTLYILDEPTIGLHPYDIQRLIKIIQKLVDSGNTVIMIEHNIDVISVSDYVIDLGPEGGDRGGAVVAIGTPEAIMTCENSYTGQFLKQAVEGRR